MNHTWLMNGASVALSIYFMWVGLRVVLTRKVFVYSARRVVWVLLLTFVPTILSAGDLIYDSRTHAFDFTGPLLLVMFALVFIMAWKQMNGYFAFGATDEYFQSALYAALRKLGLPFEESFSRIRLTSLGAELDASVQPRLGTAQLMLKQSQHSSTLRQIAQAMNEYFATVPGKVNLTMSTFYILFGVLMLAYVIYFRMKFGT